MDNPAVPSNMRKSTVAGRSFVTDRALNFGLLVAGYGVGQGSIFLAQTWLLVHERVELLASFGTHFVFAMLGIIIVDAGGLTILARHAAALECGRDNAEATWRTFWEVSGFRGVLAIATVAIGIGLAELSDDPFTRSYAHWTAPALLIWAVNAAGFLDGLRLSGISGVSSSLAYVASAFALMFAPGFAPGQAGALLGVAFTAGYLSTVLVQFAALATHGWKPRFVRPTGLGIVTATRDGLALLGGTLPGQLYFRAQLLICSAWFGPATTALLVYARQVINAAVQLIGFIRRVEFPTLVREIAQESGEPAATIWRYQRLGTQLSVIGALCVAVASISTHAMTSGPTSEVGGLLTAYSVIVALSGVYLGFSQGLAALGRYRTMLMWSISTSAVGLIMSALLVRGIGVYGFALADALSFTFGIIVVIHILRRRR